ncbi:MAG: DNA repair protein RecN [Thermodesulfobacteriota bacterium]
MLKKLLREGTVLDQLQIKNLALIDRVSLSLSGGLNILSGETGAGKSILIKAVNLLLGERPSADTVRHGAEEALIEALFTLPSNPVVKELLESSGLPFEEQIQVKRTIQNNGKTRAWINGSLISQAVLTRITRSLIGISNQHEYQSLLNPIQHLYLLDRFAGLLSLREKVQTRFEVLEEHLKRLGQLDLEEQKRKSQMELWIFQSREIGQAELRPGEDLELQQRKQVLQQAEKIWEKVYQARQDLSEEDRSCLGTLASVRDLVRSAASMDAALQPFLQELEALQVQMNEIDTGLRDYLSGLVFDPKILEEVEDRLDRIRRLTVKYGSSIDEVIRYGKEIEDRLRQGENQVFRRKELEEEIIKERKELLVISSDLSSKRKKAAKELSDLIGKELKGLGMKECRFEMQFAPLVSEGEADDAFRQQGVLLGKTGMEKGEFFIAPNPGEGLRPLVRIASGGELSRILLVLKKLLSEQDALETLIFDEVDAGIGGSLGEAVGRKLAELSGSHQVICITHLPQIAAFAETHFLVGKSTRNQRTQTGIRLLKKEERAVELARMLSGSSPSPHTLLLAEEMLARAGKRE